MARVPRANSRLRDCHQYEELCVSDPLGTNGVIESGRRGELPPGRSNLRPQTAALIEDHYHLRFNQKHD